MKKILFLVFLLTGCTTYHQTISSYNKIDSNAKTVTVEGANTTDIYQEFKQVLNQSGFKVYNKDDGLMRTRYELSGDIVRDDNVRCGLWEDGYTYDITFMDNMKKTEVFGMEGQGCHDNVIKDFTALVNNRYDENEKVEETQNEDMMRAPSLKSDGRTWWSN